MITGEGYDVYRLGFYKFIFMMMIIFYIIHEGYQFKSLSEQLGLIKGYRAYIWCFENALDTILVILFLFHITTVGYNNVVLGYLNSQLLRLKSEFYSFDAINDLEKTIQTQCNIMIFVAFIKGLNLLKFNPKTYLITDTLSTSFFELTFLIIFVLLNYAIFGFIGYGLFYIDPQFRDIKTSIQTSIISIVRHIDFDFLLENRFEWLYLWQSTVWLYAQRTLINFVISVIISYFNQVRLNHEKSATEKTFSRIVKNSLDYFNF